MPDLSGQYILLTNDAESTQAPQAEPFSVSSIQAPAHGMISSILPFQFFQLDVKISMHVCFRYLTDLSIPNPNQQVNGHINACVYCMKMDRTGQFALTGADDGLVKVWCIRTGRLMFTLRGHAGVITDLAISPDNTMAATCSDDRTVSFTTLCNT